MKKKVTKQTEETPNADVVKETRHTYMSKAMVGTRQRNNAGLPAKTSGGSSDPHPEESSVFSIPEFRTQEEFDAWWDALPKVKAEVDPRLKERIKTSIRLSRRTIEGFDFLAKQKGIRSGQTLMKVVLESYLSKSLPPDF